MKLISSRPFFYHSSTIHLLLSLTALVASLGATVSQAAPSLAENSKKASDSNQVYGNEVSLFALKAQGWQIHPQPVGQKITKVHVLSLPVFLKREGLKQLGGALNLFHVTTKSSVIKRESRLFAGEEWSAANALETERNLRGLAIFSSAQVYPVTRKFYVKADSAPLEVLIVTRDLWSLRLESAFSYNGGVLNNLNLSLSERNLLGRRILLSAQSALSPYNFIGGVLVNHRRFGPDLSLSAQVSGAWSRDDGQREGESVQVSLSRPLFNLDQKWSFGTSLGYTRQRARIGRGGVLLTDDDPATPNVEQTPIQWELKAFLASLGATRQWQGAYQKSLSLQLGFSQSDRAVLPDVSSSQEARFRELYLPPDRLQIGPSISFSWYKRKYIALTNISTYGLREDLRIGPSLSTSHQWIVWGDQAYLPSLSLSYTHSLQNKGFVSASVGASARIEAPKVEAIYNQVLALGLSAALPVRFMSRHHGYLVARMSLSERRYDVNNTLVVLGGDAGIRGYPNGAFNLIGGGVSRNNFEYRSLPLRWHFIHLGLAVFYEGGSVYQTIKDYDWKHSTGLGLRLLFPQVNRSVFRFDLARPLSPYPDGLHTPPVVFSFGSSQAFWFMPWES